MLRFAREAWPLRAAEELRSALVFRALARACAATAALAPWAPRFADGMRDEVFHARLCASVGARLGARPPTYDATQVRNRLGPLQDPFGRALALVLIEVAVGETVSTCLFRAARRNASEPLTRAALEVILSDEIRHQQLGWEALAAWWPLLEARQRAALSEEARLGFGAMEQQIAAPAFRWLAAQKPFDDAYAALGVIEPSIRVEAFYDAIEKLVLPRLDKLGLEAAAAWRDRYAPRVD